MDAVDQIVNYTFKGGEMLFRISGAAAKNLAVLIAALMKDSYKTSGKTRMARFYREGKDQKVITIPRGGLRDFHEMSKKYGVLYCVINDKTSAVGIDLVVKAEDAAKITRIYEVLNWDGVIKEVADIKAIDPKEVVIKDADVITIEEPDLTPPEQELAALEAEHDAIFEQRGTIQFREDQLKEAGQYPDRFPQTKIESMRDNVAEAKKTLQTKYGLEEKDVAPKLKALISQVKAKRQEVAPKNPTKEPHRSGSGSVGSHLPENNIPAQRSIKERLSQITQNLKQQPQPATKQRARAKAKVKD